MSARRGKSVNNPLSAHDPSLLPSDDEDEDFVAGSGSDSSSDDSEDERPAKKAKVVEKPAEPALTKEDVDDLWASFNAPEPDTAAASSSSTAPKKVEAPKKIKITVQYEFAGETVTQEKEVLADSDEAKTWLAKQATLPSTASTPAPLTPADDDKGKGKASSLDALFGPESDSATSAPVPAEDKPEPPKPKAGPPKRAKGGLGALAASLAKPAKLNTLEKSKMDWNKFVAKEDLSDDLTRARKDGYLEKQDFLQRTEQAREDAYDKTLMDLVA
ncbi:craniofacial development protein 1 [Pseudohyphozyma bogoriensis]|nr:craniofacial development protein 1 [Pseudohyphozyma bogoriensis]